MKEKEIYQKEPHHFHTYIVCETLIFLIIKEKLLLTMETKNLQEKINQCIEEKGIMLGRQFKGVMWCTENINDCPYYNPKKMLKFKKSRRVYGECVYNE